MKKWCLVFVPLLLLLGGCATSAKMSAQEVTELKPNEGRVIGSFLVSVSSDKDPSSWAWLKGRKAEDFKYALTIEPPSAVPNPFARRYAIVATPGREETFVMKLPAGRYDFTKMEPRGPPDLQGFRHFDTYIGQRFVVTAQKTTYIGRLSIKQPERLKLGSGFEFRMEDMQDETLALLKGQYGGALTNVVKGLAR